MRKNSQKKKKKQYRGKRIQVGMQQFKLKEKLAMMGLLNTAAWKEVPILVCRFWAGKEKGTAD